MGTGVPDYQPLDLGPSCNAGPELLPDGAPLLVGEQAFRGLPFRIGPAAGAAERCFVAFGPGHHAGPVTVPVGTTARTLVVAHRLLESTLLEGGPVGQAVAEWTFGYGDGTE